MSFFNFKKKENKKVPFAIENAKEKSSKISSIKVLGAGCKNCHALYENRKKAVGETYPEINVEYITDMEKIMSYGVMSMPALVVDERKVSTGKVLKTEEIKKLIKQG